MARRSTARIAACSLAAFVLLAGGAVPVRLVEQERIVLTITPLDTTPAAGSRPTPWVLEVPDRGAELRGVLVWPERGSTAALVLRARPRPPQHGEKTLLLLEAEVELPATGRRAIARRELAFNDSFTALFEVFREGERSLTLAIEAEATRETVLAARAAIGPPIELGLEIQHVLGEQAVTLETNRLHTFVGEPVSYSFRLGQPGLGTALSVQLRPLRLYGDVARIAIDVSGTLPDGHGTSMISRQEEWLTTRGATSSLGVQVGDPPTGYRFLVTPLF